MNDLISVCNAWHVDSLERLKARINEVLPLVTRTGPIYVCQPELARKISVSAQRLLGDINTFLEAADAKSREANGGSSE